ncbi:hypothetical protein AB0I51_05685 [Streptomyces sp. NPDC050549]|uniref:hypothetical protein n=1 Tax=Streptomyces sp. NPDC050549 TaxID=3155406 RepID=UPI00344422B1
MTNLKKLLTLGVIATCLLSGCSAAKDAASSASGESKKPAMKITMQQAADRADSMLDATFDAIKPEVHWTHGATTTGSCDLSRRRVVMTTISQERLGSFLGLVQRSWEKSGYHIKSVDRDEKFPAIYAQSTDGFGIDLTVGAERQVFFEVATPCAKPSDVADPTSSPNGPAYSYPIPHPNVRSDFWSSTTPVASATPSDKS